MMWKQKFIAKFAETMVLNVETPPPIAQPRRSLSESRVALLTTAGVHLLSQPVFDVKRGDSSYRPIPSETPVSELIISHTHYDTADAEKDINCVFPIERLRELAEDGSIGSVGNTHFGLMGYIPNPIDLQTKAAPEIVERLMQDEVDLVILSPG